MRITIHYLMEMCMPYLVRDRSGAGNSFELRITHKLLDKPWYGTFPDHAKAENTGKKTIAMLERGVVPDWLKKEDKLVFSTLVQAIREYIRMNTVPDSTLRLLYTLERDLGTTPLTEIDFPWVQRWVRRQKLEHHRGPTTIRHHVGALARCLDWVRKNFPETSLSNPLRELTRGYAKLNEDERRELAAQGIEPKDDAVRDRRVSAEEEALIYAVFKNRLEKAATPEERLFHLDAELMFRLALESAMRMREMYTLSWEHVVLEQKTIFLKHTKNGRPRQVPTTSVAIRLLREKQLANRDGANSPRVFCFWDGNWARQVLEKLTSDLSRYYGEIFREAGLEDLHFHDTRHEATCRIVLYTRMGEVQISRITGHEDPRMLRRYMSLRASELADQLW